MQNKLWAIFLAMVLLLAMVHFVPRPLHRQLDVDNASCQVFCTQTTLAHQDVGFGKIVSCNAADICQTLAQCKHVDGVSFSFIGCKQSVAALVRKLAIKVHTTQNLEGLVVVCGYSPKVSGFVVLDGHKTNVQIAFDGTHITIGSPLILGDY